MVNYYPPKANNYEIEIPKSLWELYKGMHWNERIKIEMDTFEDSQKAIDIIKNWMDKGAYTFCHFTSDYKKLVIFRDKDTDEYINKIKDAKG